MNLTALALLFAGATPTPRPNSGTAASAPGATPTEVATNGGATGTLLLALALLFAGYLVSLKLHPFSKCPTCKGGGRHRGAVFTYASRPCSACGGRGVQPRLGRRIFFRASD